MKACRTVSFHPPVELGAQLEDDATAGPIAVAAVAAMEGRAVQISRVIEDHASTVGVGSVPTAREMVEHLFGPASVRVRAQLRTPCPA